MKIKNLVSRWVIAIFLSFIHKVFFIFTPLFTYRFSKLFYFRTHRCPYFVGRVTESTRLVFLGTKGYIDVETPFHSKHTSLLVERNGKKIMIDCGEDWTSSLHDVNPDAILITHYHPDHAYGLLSGAPCPVYVTPQTYDLMAGLPIKDLRVVTVGKPFKVYGVYFTPYAVEHSVLSPAVGYKFTVSDKVVFYAPDVIYIDNRKEALYGVDLYIGDGASLGRSLIRRRNERLIGHTTVKSQVSWCSKEKVPDVIITHCGSDIVGHDPRVIERHLIELGREYGVDVTLAKDGMELDLK